MTSPIGNPTGRNAGRGAFTLIELILVMALLVIVLGVAFPSLRSFFRGRDLDSEAKRFLALTRYGQSRAVSEGAPMALWVDEDERTYGLQMAASYAETDTNAVEFTMNENLEIEVTRPVVRAPTMRFSSTTTGTRSGLTTTFGVGTTLPGRARDVPMIQFTPDGFITEASLESVMIREDDKHALWIAQSRNRLNYEIRTNEPPLTRR